MTSFMISPLLLTRVAGLPSDVLDLVAPATRKLLAEQAAASAQLSALAPELTEALFALVPRLDDDVPLRRKALAAKRAVNRLDPLPWDESVRRRLAERLPPHSASLLDDWTRLVGERQGLLEQLGAQLVEDRQRAIQTLHRTLETAGDAAGTTWECGFAESLAIAAPDWIRHRDHKVRSAKKLKTLYSYVARAAVKTSPFSGLTTVGEAGARGRGRGHSRTSAITAHLALRRLARDPSTADLLRYRVAPVRPGTLTEPNGLLLHSEVINTEGVVWRHDRAVEADYALPSLRGLRSGATFAELLAAVGGKRPFARFVRLMDAGVIHPVPPWTRGEAPFPALAALLEDDLTPSPIGRRDLSRAHSLGDGAWRQSTEGRIAAAAELRDLTGDWNEHSAGGERRSSGLVYEDRETALALPDPLTVPEVLADLTALGERTRPYLFRSHLYDLLLERFTAEFGAGGVCRDPLGFLMRLTVDRDANPPLERALFADMASRRDPGDRAWLPVGPTSAPPNAGVFFQMEAESQADIEAGRYLLVVNQYGAGTGGLFSRFGRLLGDGFADRLAAHIERCWSGVSCRELVVWTDCNTVQSECGGLLPPLVLPGEVEASGENGLTLDDTVLVHDVADDTLSLFDRAGEPVGLAYLGLIPQHLLQSYVRLLAVLADPWVNGSPYSDYTMTKAYELGPLCGDGVVELPRVTEGPGGRLVTRRASWIVPASAIPRPDDGDRDETALAVRLDAFRRTHGIPQEVFVHQLAGAGGALGMTADRKPMWVSLASPLSVGVLHHWLSPQTSHLRLVEALPRRSLHPQRDTHGRPRATEHVALLAWPEENR
ncbi:lantibiotic dehydratase [Streptomyces sp. Li-HN-5-11]|uniref:lantibiotic dehydratase n=1 Tax=Streptomyces sp. Li-HN-5-11 TaxID=3075432 RepID=UPI0028ACD7A1|nr:lantibiotic dehydratase [Streptomyces sp. Li-HN-5-11]WNM29193.1 lantibiotic dehydratase [Streptomyces sp. Li-HN-5-11]